MTELNIEYWLDDLAVKRPQLSLDKIRQAINLAQLASEDYLRQGLAMAEVLTELNVDEDTLAAAIVCNALLYTDLDIEDVNETLGSRASNLIKHVKQMEGISELSYAVAHHDEHHPKVDNIRKMMLAIVNDIRAVLIKLAAQLILLRSSKALDDERKRRIGQETMAIYAPLANRLGIGAMKWELEDLAFRYIQPDIYKEISTALNQRRADREQYVKELIQQLTQMLHQAGIQDIEVTGRVKHIYSIYNKMQRKDVDFKEVYDVTALRVLVPTLADCYTVLSNVHSTWEHVPEEFDDYAANPKPNGYQSIHTAVIGKHGRTFEIQIRTHVMHEDAELGVAAHWVYKEGAQGDAYEAKIAWLRQVMDWQQEVTQADEASNLQEVFADRVYVFTPQGDIMDLPQGSTGLDFAYHVHSEVGHRCRGVKVGGNIVNLTYQLQTGDAVEILTGKEPHPSRDWMNPHFGFLHTSRARGKVHSWFKKQDYDRHVEMGQEMLEKEIKRLHLKNINLTDLAHQFKYKTSEELFAGLGSGYFKIGSVTNFLQQEQKEELPEPEAVIRRPTGKPSAIVIEGVDNLLTNIANCCQPVPGDAIIGYVTQGKGVTIHRQDCFNVLRAEAEKPERLLAVNWSDTSTNYPINLIIEAYDRHGLIKDITNVLNDEKVSLLGLNYGARKIDDLAFINLTVEINNLALLEQIMIKLKSLADVTAVRRA